MKGYCVFPVPWLSRWSWSLHLFFGCPIFLCPFGLYCSACFGILFVSILCTCCSQFFWYCCISCTMFCAPIFSLIHWFFSLSNFVIPSKVSGVIQMLICKTHKTWANQPQQQQRLCRQILLPRRRRLRPRDPWAMQLKLQQTGEGAGESPAPENWAHSAKGAHRYRKACRSRGIKVAAPPLDSPCDRPVTYPGDSKHYS